MSGERERPLACPFCGDDQIDWLRSKERDLIWTGLECRSCMATLKWFESRTQTLEAWNRRTPPPAAPELLAMLERHWHPTTCRCDDCNDKRALLARLKSE